MSPASGILVAEALEHSQFSLWLNERRKNSLEQFRRKSGVASE
jgi:hypothetical protein